MGKGLRSKYQRRIRTVRRQHYWEVEGKHKLDTLSRKLQDPLYDFRQDVELKKNAFLEPNNPEAVFPQNSKPHIIDFRDHKMAGAGFASVGNFRKSMSDRSIPNKYASVSKTAEDLEAEKIAEEIAAQAKMDESDNEVDIGQVEYTVDDITKGFEKQLRVRRNTGEFKPLTKEQEKANKLAKVKKTQKNKKNRRQLTF